MKSLEDEVYDLVTLNALRRAEILALLRRVYARVEKIPSLKVK